MFETASDTKKLSSIPETTNICTPERLEYTPETPHIPLDVTPAEELRTGSPVTDIHELLPQGVYAHVLERSNQHAILRRIFGMDTPYDYELGNVCASMDPQEIKAITTLSKVFGRQGFNGLTNKEIVNLAHSLDSRQDRCLQAADPESLWYKAIDHVANGEPITNTVPGITCSPVHGHETAICDIEDRVYPSVLQTYQTEEYVESTLDQPLAAHLSFTASRPGTPGEIVGYCIAHLTSSYRGGSPALLIENLAVIPEAQRGLVGVQMFRESLNRAEDAGLSTILFAARETTSYRMITSPLLRHRLEEWGYVIHCDPSPSPAGQENLYLVELQKSSLAALAAQP